MAAIGGIMAASRLFAVNQSSGGSDLLLLAIAGPVIAGTSLFGGRGSVWTALLGALVIGSISNGMDLLALPVVGEVHGHRCRAADRCDHRRPGASAASDAGPGLAQGPIREQPARYGAIAIPRGFRAARLSPVIGEMFTAGPVHARSVVAMTKSEFKIALITAGLASLALIFCLLALASLSSI